MCCDKGKAEEVMSQVLKYNYNSMQVCEFCGSNFGDWKCYFCGKRCCSSCMTNDHSRCKKCYVKRAKLGWRVLKRNRILLICVGLLWVYAVFPGPFLPGLGDTFYWASLVAAILFTIPVGLMMFFWSQTPPSSDIKRR